MGFPHNIKGQGVYAYIVLKDGYSSSTEQIINEAKSAVRKNIASYAVPEYIQVSKKAKVVNLVI